jgi:RNA polymerase sigma-70 factor (ECF subfamily)
MIDFEELYEAYAPHVYRFAFWLAGDSAEAEDITSETFVRAWVRRARIRTETLKAYLFTIARNVYLAHQRKRKREVPLEDAHADPAPGPDTLAEARSELREVQSLLQTLPEIDRTTFLLRVQQGLPYAEIARVVGLHPSTAKVKVHRVRKRLLVMRAEREDSSP